jgi:serine/threonine protein phosphatase PrpC
VELDGWVTTRRSRRHERNEDRAVVGPDVVAEVEQVERRRLTTPALLAALDGLGGHSAGDVASELAAKVLAAAEVPTDEAAAAALLELADRTLHDAMQADPSRDGMGATVAMIAIDGDSAVAANAGDASCWRSRDGRLEVLSVTDRLGGSGVLQCLGAHDGVTPHVREVALEVGDRLLLASDGLTDVVPHEVLEATLAGDVSGAAAELLHLVEAAQLPDDVTIVVAEVVDR